MGLVRPLCCYVNRIVLGGEIFSVSIVVWGLWHACICVGLHVYVCKFIHVCIDIGRVGPPGVEAFLGGVGDFSGGGEGFLRGVADFFGGILVFFVSVKALWATVS